MNNLTRNKLTEILDYNPLTGAFIDVETGEILGRASIQTGYVTLKIDGQQYYAQELAWLYTTGTAPIGCVGHINYDRGDNRWANLEQAATVKETPIAKAATVKAPIANGTNGCVLDRETGLWWSMLRVDGKLTKIGKFTTREMAYDAREAAKKALT